MRAPASVVDTVFGPLPPSDELGTYMSMKVRKIRTLQSISLTLAANAKGILIDKVWEIGSNGHLMCRDGGVLSADCSKLRRVC